MSLSRTAPALAAVRARLPEHLPVLDGVRGIAVLWVVMHNLTVAEETQLTSVTGKLLVAGLDSGWVAVTLFFALSGFLITGILLDSQQRPDYYRSFFVRRVLRIFPLYYAVLLVAFGVLPLLMSTLPAHLAADRPHQLWLWAYLSNWVEPYGITGSTFPHFWSLAVEEQFYLLWPFLVRRRDPRAVVRLCLGLALAALGFRIALFVFHAPKEASYMFTFARMDALALGAAAAAALRVAAWRTWLVSHAARLAAAAVAIFLACGLMQRGLPPMSPTTGLIGHSLLGVSCALLVMALASTDCAGITAWWTRPWRAAPLAVLAKYSYGMYVIHKVLGDTIGRPLMRAHPQWLQSIPAHLAYVCLGALASFGAAVLSYHLLEKHFLQLKPLLARPAAAASPT